LIRRDIGLGVIVQCFFIDSITPPNNVKSTTVRILETEENDNGSNCYTRIQCSRENIVISTPPLKGAQYMSDLRREIIYLEVAPSYPVLEHKACHGPG
jgi:hypothetical protein